MVRFESLVKEKDCVEEQLSTANNLIDEQERGLTEASERALELLKKLTDSNEEIDTLKAYIIDLKARVAIYVPIKGCQIDKKLAEYINNYPDRNKLRIIFMRESEGVY